MNEAVSSRPDAFGITPETLLTARSRGDFRLAQIWVPGEVSRTSIARYEECKEAHAKLELGADDACRRLVDVLDCSVPADYDDHGAGVRKMTWRGRVETLPNATQTYVAYQITTRTRPRVGFPHDDYNEVLGIKIYPLHYTEHDDTNLSDVIRFGGVLPGHVAFKADALTLSLRGKDLWPRSFGDIELAAVTQLHKRARQGVLERYVDGYVAAVESDKQASAAKAALLGVPESRDDTQWNERHGLALFKSNASKHKRVGEMLVELTTSREQAMSVLDNVFGDATARASVDAMLSRPAEEMSQVVDEYGLTARYGWFMQNLVAIQRAINDEARQLVALHFYDTCMTELDKEKAKVDRVIAIAAQISDMSDISSCVPKDSK